MCSCVVPHLSIQCKLHYLRKFYYHHFWLPRLFFHFLIYFAGEWRKAKTFEPFHLPKILSFSYSVKKIAKQMCENSRQRPSGKRMVTHGVKCAWGYASAVG